MKRHGGARSPPPRADRFLLLQLTSSSGLSGQVTRRIDPKQPRVSQRRRSHYVPFVGSTHAIRYLDNGTKFTIPTKHILK